MATIKWSVRRSAALLVILGGIGAGWLESCSDDKNPSNPPPTDCAREKVLAANAALEQVLYEQLNDNAEDPEHPFDVDFREAEGLYQAALDCDATDPDALFGSAITGLLILSSDKEINAAFDEWKAYLEDHTPFEVPGGSGRALGIPVVPSGDPDALRLPFDLIPMSALALATGGFGTPDPQLARVQAILRERVIPRAHSAAAHLAQVIATPGYTYQVTPRMQGDNDADAAEIDRTDLLLLRSACSLLEAACNVAAAYEVNFAAYDSLTLLQSVEQGSAWLGLRSDGEARMSSAHGLIVSSVQDLDQAITSLLTEIDNQDNDVIKIGPNDLSRADVDSIRVHLPDVLDALATGYTRVDDWDQDRSTPDIALEIHVGELFLDPVANWKSLMPSYTARVTRRAQHLDFKYTQVDTLVTVSGAPAGTFYAHYAAYYETPTDFDEFHSGEEWLWHALRDVVQERVSRLTHDPRWPGDLSASLNGATTTPGGTALVEVTGYSYWALASSWVFVPVVVWDAESFEQWILPDPTISGILPGMGSTDEVWQTFGIDGRGWQREWVVDWTDFDIGIDRP